MKPTIIQSEILKTLSDNGAKLVYGIGDYPIAISYEKSGKLPIEILEEVKHISKEVYLKCN